VQRGDDWASSKRFTNRATGNTTRVTRGDQGGMISRRGEGGSGFVGQRGDNVYAGRDGNAYRRDQNGNWSKWDSGGWNQVQRPEGDSVRDSMLNDRARDRERQNGNRGQSDSARGERVSGSTRGQVDPSTYRNLQRDRANRSEGSRRSSDFGTYNRSSGSSRSAGSFRSGGGRGGGGFRGGGGRRR